MAHEILSIICKISHEIHVTTNNIGTSSYMTEEVSAAAKIARDIRQTAQEGKRIAFISGNFNIVHPGHLRLLSFAADCCDYLAVGITQDSQPGVHIPAQLRLDGISAISLVDHAFLLPGSPEEFIEALKPEIVIKGKEHENLDNKELKIVESYGGKLLFSSGEITFSSIDLLQKELETVNLGLIDRHKEFLERHRFNQDKVVNYVKNFSQLKVVVIGDLIIDEYITCNPVGMSQEDPTIVVTPLKNDLFVGGGGIVAAHAGGMGANVKFISVIGDDETGRYAQRKLKEYDNVEALLIPDESRPTTLKQRFRTRGKTLLRVNHLRHHDISLTMIDKVLENAKPMIDEADLLIFSDFNYGNLPDTLIIKLSNYCRDKNVMMVADSQASSQVSDVSRFKGMHLITPTEYEARLAVRDTTSGLVSLSEKLQKKSQADHLLITLADEGVFINAPDSPSNGLITDQLPAFNTAPKDVSGAGDSLLTCASMALCVGANIWEAAYLGSIAAAIQVGRVGNLPLTAEELTEELTL